MKQASFLARKTLGQPNYFLIALATAFVVALAPHGFRKAIEGSANRPDHWQPDAAAVQDLDWFRAQFGDETALVVSWDGCTLGNKEKLRLLKAKLDAGNKAGQPRDDSAPSPAAWYEDLATGPELLAQLTAAPYELPHATAISRLEGALIGPPERDARGNPRGEETRPTCLVVRLSPETFRSEAATRTAIENIRQVASSECGIEERLRVAGYPAERIAIDADSRKVAIRWTLLAGAISFALAYWRLGSGKMATVTAALGLTAAMMSLAVVFYFGVFEVLALDFETPRIGVADGLAMMVPPLVFALGVFCAVRLIFFYRDARVRHSSAPAEEAFIHVWRSSALAAATAAACLAMLCLTDVTPIRRFGLFSALGLLIVTALALTIVPVLLHRWPPDESFVSRLSSGNQLRRRLRGIFDQAVLHPLSTLAMMLILAAVAGAGISRLQPSLRLPPLLARNSALVRDYQWYESRLGNVVPLEAVISVPVERCRNADESAEAVGSQYRLSPQERMELVQQIERRILTLPEISGAVGAQTYLPAELEGDAASSEAIDQLIPDEYWRQERRPGTKDSTGRELWRICARMSTMADDQRDANYSDFITRFEHLAAPVLVAQEQRNVVVRNLHERASQLAGSKLTVLFYDEEEGAAPDKASQETLLADLLGRSGVANNAVEYFNLGLFESPPRRNAAIEYRQEVLSKFADQAGVILVSLRGEPAAQAKLRSLVNQLVQGGVNVIDVSDPPRVKESAEFQVVDPGGPRPIRFVTAGIAPIAHQTQQQLFSGLMWFTAAAAVVVLAAMLVAVRNLPAALAASVVVLLPLVVTLGLIGWLGVTVDMGVVLPVALALVVSMEGSMHYLAWFRRGVSTGLIAKDAAVVAYERTAPALIESTLITAISLSVFVFSSLAAVQQFGALAFVILSAALAATLILLPATVASPLARCFEAGVPVANEDWEPEPTLKHVPAVPAPAKLAHQQSSSSAPAEIGPADRPRPAVTVDPRHESPEGPHAALQAKLRRMRRSSSGDHPTSS